MMIVDKPTPSTPVEEKVFSPNEKELPPPYAPSRGGPSSMPAPALASPVVDSLIAQPELGANVSMDRMVFQPTGVTRVNNYWLYSKHAPISGTFIVDSVNPSASFGACHKKARMPRERKNKIFFKQKHTIPNASFCTRHQNITLDLSIEGKASNKAFVSARSRHGKITMNVTALEAKCHALFEVETRHGQITLYLPPTFDGLIQIRRRNAPVEFLPEFARNARVIQGSDNASLIRYSGPLTEGQANHVVSGNDMLSDWLDHCLVGSRNGKIVIGISGVDHYEPPKHTTLIKKMKSMFISPS